MRKNIHAFHLFNYLKIGNFLLAISQRIPLSAVVDSESLIDGFGPLQLIQKLKEEAAQATEVSKEMEEKYHKTAEELDYTRAKLESAWLKNNQLEMELKSKGSGSGRAVAKANSNKNLARSASNVKKSASTIKAPPPDEEDEEEEEEEEETETEGK